MSLPLATTPRFGAITPQEAPLLQMPIDPHILIFQRLNGGDINALTLSCKHLYSIFENDMTWKQLFAAHFPLFDSPGVKNYKAAYQAQFVYLKFEKALDLVIVRRSLYEKLDGRSIFALGLSSKHLHSCVQDDAQNSRYLSEKLQKNQLFNSLSKAIGSNLRQEPTPDTNRPMGISLSSMMIICQKKH